MDFIYGIGIPEDYSKEDARSILAMADLYLMDDLKDAVGSLIGTKQTNKDNILEIYELSEKYSNKKMEEICYQFVFQNLEILDKNQLTELCKFMPLLGQQAVLELQKTKGRPQNSVDVANKVLGITLGDPFKKRRDFCSLDDYKGYVMGHIKPNMLVLCIKNLRESEREETKWDCGKNNISEGTICRVIKMEFKGASVKWAGFSKAHCSPFISLELLTPPIAGSLFKD